MPWSLHYQCLSCNSIIKRVSALDPPKECPKCHNTEFIKIRLEPSWGDSIALAESMATAMRLEDRVNKTISYWEKEDTIKEVPKVDVVNEYKSFQQEIKESGLKLANLTVQIFQTTEAKSDVSVDTHVNTLVDITFTQYYDLSKNISNLREDIEKTPQKYDYIDGLEKELLRFIKEFEQVGRSKSKLKEIKEKFFKSEKIKELLRTENFAKATKILVQFIELINTFI